jgi:uncharacterized membrane protein YedE/YeeE
MGGAVAVTAVLFQLVLRRPNPLFAPEFHVPTSRTIDARLIGGSALFGVGWGLAGFCPGPAVASLAYGLPQSVLFVVAMVVGMAIWERRSVFTSWLAQREAPTSRRVNTRRHERPA